ncbi:uncharacterized protein VP01_1529g2 [Puccinia sorghi]|uniref:Uncharacterized protein n=1 Tax=Puccinia sorghi TaxID=27349 RepID=A0A0L6VIR8_9BASI|nr:uncharacterized protein VP01_1529g2 [Puccinia sorghi]
MADLDPNADHTSATHSISISHITSNPDSIGLNLNTVLKRFTGSFAQPELAETGANYTFLDINVSTQWNLTNMFQCAVKLHKSCIKLRKSCIKLRKSCMHFCNEDNNAAKHHFSAAKWTQLTSLMQLLEPLCEATKMLCASNYQTLNKALPIYIVLCKHLQRVQRGLYRAAFLTLSRSQFMSNDKIFIGKFNNLSTDDILELFCSTAKEFAEKYRTNPQEPIIPSSFQITTSKKKTSSLFYSKLYQADQIDKAPDKIKSKIAILEKSTKEPSYFIKRWLIASLPFQPQARLLNGSSLKVAISSLGSGLHSNQNQLRSSSHRIKFHTGQYIFKTLNMTYHTQSLAHCAKTPISRVKKCHPGHLHPGGGKYPGLVVWGTALSRAEPGPRDFWLCEFSRLHGFLEIQQTAPLKVVLGPSSVTSPYFDVISQQIQLRKQDVSNKKILDPSLEQYTMEFPDLPTLHLQLPPSAPPDPPSSEQVPTRSSTVAASNSKWSASDSSTQTVKKKSNKGKKYGGGIIHLRLRKQLEISSVSNFLPGSSGKLMDIVFGSGNKLIKLLVSLIFMIIFQ